MSTYRLDKLFSPRSVAVVGASPRETSPGRAVLRNLGSAGFEGSVSLVNPRYGEIEGIKAVKTIQELPQAPDLLVIAAPPRSVTIGSMMRSSRSAAAAAPTPRTPSRTWPAPSATAWSPTWMTGATTTSRRCRRFI
mgnify:CR=1 FL=1